MADTNDALSRMGDMFGFGDWNLGIGTIGTMLIWFFLAFFVVAIVGIGVYFVLMRKTYRHKITVRGLVGNQPMIRWRDRAKEVRIGRAGDTLFYLKKKKRFLPPPIIQDGVNEWLYWEREDGELINVGIENVDEKQRKLGIKFIDTDMRMQRLGIEKLLQARLQKQTFWEKHGTMVVSAIFYVLLTILLVVIFTQWIKSTQVMGAVTNRQADLWEKMIREEEVSPYVPTESEGSGLIPANFILPLIKTGIT